MKTTHKLCAAALVALAGVAVATTSTKAAGDPLKWASSADIEFKKGAPTTDTNQPPSSSKDTGTDLKPNPEPGDLKVIAATPLKFGKQDVKNSNTNRNYNAGLHVANPENLNNDRYEVSNYVHFKDVRAEANHHYILNAEMTKPFTSLDAAADKLAGATLVYSNLRLEAADSNKIEENKMPVGVKTDIKLKYDPAGITGKQPAIVNNDANDPSRGWGDYYLFFGTDNKTGAESVVLDIPTTDSILLKKYQAEITWTLEDII